MRLAMIIDAQRLAVEQRLLNRLGVGLMAEGVELVRIVPEGLHREALDEGERRIALAQRLEAPMRVLPWLRGSRMRRVAAGLEAALPDALYLLGVESWTLGLDLAAELDRPALIEVSSPAVAQMVPRPQSSAHIAGYITPCQGIARHAIERVGGDLVHVVPMGVSPNRQKRAVFRQVDSAHSLAVLGSATDVSCYAALLQGLAEVFEHFTNLEVFMELRGRREHEIWRAAERLNLLGKVTIMGPAAEHRPLLLRCDGLVLPERRGELRSLMLEAMASGMPVIAASDPALDMLRDDETARLVHSDNARDWATVLRALLAAPDAARALGARGREAVVARHRSSEQVAAMASLIDLVGRGSFAFTPAAGPQA